MGRILNKFSKDAGYMDDLLPMTFYDFLQCVTWCAASILLCCVINPAIFLVVCPLLVCFARLRRYFLCTSREVKRLDAVSVSFRKKRKETIKQASTSSQYCTPF